MLSLKLVLDVVAECTEFQTLVRALIINLLVKLVLLIVKLLQNVLFTVDTRLHLIIKGALLVLKVCAHDQNRLITLNNAVLDLLVDAIFDVIHAFLSNFEFVSIMFTHFTDLFFKVFLKKTELVLEFRSESFESVLHSFHLSVCEVFIGLDLAVDVLELSLQLFL